MSIYNSESEKSSIPLIVIDLDLPNQTLGSIINQVRNAPQDSLDIVCTSVYDNDFGKLFTYVVEYLQECGKTIRFFYRGEPRCCHSTDKFKFYVKIKRYSQDQIDKFKLNAF